MGIFSGLFKSRDKPQNRTAGSNYAFFLGGTTSGKTVTERSAMQMTAVYSCVRECGIMNLDNSKNDKKERMRCPKGNGSGTRKSSS